MSLLISSLSEPILYSYNSFIAKSLFKTSLLSSFNSSRSNPSIFIDVSPSSVIQTGISSSNLICKEGSIIEGFINKGSSWDTSNVFEGLQRFEESFKGK